MGKTDNEEDYDSEKDFETLKKNLKTPNCKRELPLLITS